MISTEINGQTYEFAPGLTILQALREAGVSVPALCHDDRLQPCGACRLCIVEVAGFGRPVAGCTTPLAGGMRIATHTPALERERRTILRLLAARYPAGAAVRAPDKQFHRLLAAYGLEAGTCDTEEIAARVDESHPYIRVDMSRCVLCYRCVRICSEVQGQFTWQVWYRGDRTRIRPDSGERLGDSSCVGCGACASTCPTGAIADKTPGHRLATHQPATHQPATHQPATHRPPGTAGDRTAIRWTRTTCAYCGVGCTLEAGVREGARAGMSGGADERIVAVRPAPIATAPVNRGHLCVKGRYAFDYVYAADRITSPMVRPRGGEWRTVPWDEAIAHVAAEFRRIRAAHGPDGIGVLGSSRATNEENYLAQKFARAVIGTNNVDCCARVCHAPTAAAMRMTLGTGAATNSFADIEAAGALLVCGANPTENHPVIGARIKQRALRGAVLIVVDPRRIELARYAAIHLTPRPGTDVALFNAMAHTILDEGLLDEGFVAARVRGIDKFREFVRGYPPEEVAGTCGLPAAEIRRAARLYASSPPAMSIHGLGLTEHVQGTGTVATLVNLALLTGNVGRPGGGVNPLRGQNNVQGAAHMGCEPRHLTGMAPIREARELFADVWQQPVPASPGLDVLEMVDAAGEGRLKALWAIGYDILLTNPNARETARRLAKLELLVAQDLFLNETAREFATVFLPAASPFEKDGTFMNAERRIVRVRQAIEPRGESRPDWAIICTVAAAMGHARGFSFHSPAEIWEEVRRVWPAGRGITYERLDDNGFSGQWPCPAEDHPGTPILHRQTFPKGKRAALQRVKYRPPAEMPDTDFPFLLITGRSLYQFNAGTMTMRTPNAALRPRDTLDISPEDARRLAVNDGEPVRVRSRHGETILPARISRSVQAGQVFATFHTPGAATNRLTGPHRDRVTGTPAYKVTAVSLAPASRPKFMGVRSIFNPEIRKSGNPEIGFE